MLSKQAVRRYFKALVEELNDGKSILKVPYSKSFWSARSGRARSSKIKVTKHGRQRILEWGERGKFVALEAVERIEVGMASDTFTRWRDKIRAHGHDAFSCLSIYCQMELAGGLGTAVKSHCGKSDRPRERTLDLICSCPEEAEALKRLLDKLVLQAVRRATGISESVDIDNSESPPSPSLTASTVESAEHPEHEFYHAPLWPDQWQHPSDPSRGLYRDSLIIAGSSPRSKKPRALDSGLSDLVENQSVDEEFTPPPPIGFGALKSSADQSESMGSTRVRVRINRGSRSGSVSHARDRSCSIRLKDIAVSELV